MIAEEILSKAVKSSLKKALSLKPFNKAAFPAPVQNKKYMLYIHIPFCDGLCPYCSFHRFNFEENIAREYFKSLNKEIRLLKIIGFDFESMYFGGGTPTILMDELINTIDNARYLFNIKEISCETNPNHLEKSYLEQLSSRIDRLSVGVQSFNNDLLKQLQRYGRYGSGEYILERIQDAVSVFPSLNVDMIFNLPNQDESILLDDINKIILSGTNQTTFYPLMTSPSVDRLIRSNIGKIDFSREKYYYNLILENLGSVFTPTTAWTFNRNSTGMIDEYIVDYDEYIGAGSGSFSYINGTLFVNHFSLQKYMEELQKDTLPIDRMHKFNSREKMRYTFMKEIFNLKLDKNRFKENYNVPINIGLFDVMLFMNIFNAFHKTNQSFFGVNRRGMYFAVLMMREFFSGVNIIRDQARKFQ